MLPARAQRQHVDRNRSRVDWRRQAGRWINEIIQYRPLTHSSSHLLMMRISFHNVPNMAQADLWTRLAAVTSRWEWLQCELLQLIEMLPLLCLYLHFTSVLRLPVVETRSSAVAETPRDAPLFLRNVVYVYKKATKSCAIVTLQM